jgi:hypothetical protein
MDQESQSNLSQASYQNSNNNESIEESKTNNKFKLVSSNILFIVCILLISSVFAYVSITKNSTFSNLFESKPTKEVVLFGDSLIGVPNHLYDLAPELEKMIEKQRPRTDMIITASAANGNTVTDLLKRVDKDVLERPNKTPPPDGVIVLFDSDACNDLDANDDAAVLTEYKGNLERLINKLQSKISNFKPFFLNFKLNSDSLNNIHNFKISDYVALSGPILMGELPEGKNRKDAVVDQFEAVNKEVAAKLKIDYIDLRHEFQKHEPKSAKSEEQYEGKLTMDGEHPLRGGADIIKENFAAMILSWTKLFE